MIKKITTRFTPKQYLVELALGLFALFAGYLIIAWSSYSPLDSAWSVATNQTETINKAGFFGAWLIDVFFALFGYMGNIIPFALLFSALNGIWRKKLHHLSFVWWRVTGRMCGFLLLLIGASTFSALLLPNANDYLAGGAVGSLLRFQLEPLLGQFGVLLFSVSFSIIGFFVCSGSSLIRLMIGFYYWLILKNNEKVEEEEILDNSDSPDNLDAEGDTELEEITEEDSVQAQSDELNIVDIRRFGKPNISGLAKSEANTEAPQELKKVPEVATSEPVKVTPTDYKVSSTTTDNIQGVNFPADDFVLTAPTLPKVSITPVTGQNQPTPISHQEIAHNLARSETVEIPVEIPKVSLNTGANQPVEVDSPPQIEVHLNADEQPEKETTPESTPNYKPYSETLLHPSLQPKVTATVKPNTPFPSLDLLDSRPRVVQQVSEEEVLTTSRMIEQQLRNFNVKASVKDVLIGPVVTRYELELQPGVKASRVTSIDSDLARALTFRSIRVAEVIPGKPYIGIETPNLNRQIVPLRDVLDSEEFRNSKALLPMALGKDISGNAVVVDLAKMPHLLVAGSTGSGKSVGVNAMILSLLFKVKPEQVKFIMIDPKVVELSVYNDIPHLLTKVVTDMKEAASALRWCVDEMERRYQLLSALRVRNIEGFNNKIDEAVAMNYPPIPNPIWKPGDTMDSMPPALEKLSYIVVIVDEFADLMAVVGKPIEELIARLTQKARAIGIHLILATQRPSVDVITGLIKSNIPARIAFTVVQKNDSRTILDQNGAESLLGYGDMLYLANGTTELMRVHGAFMSDDEVTRVADDWRARGKPHYIEDILKATTDDEKNEMGGFASDELDDLFDQVAEFVVNTGVTSITAIQRRFKVGFSRAGRIMDQLEEQGIVSAMQNGKRDVLAPRSDY